MLEVLRGLEALAVGTHGRGRAWRAEVGGESLAEAHLPGRSCRVAAGTEEPDRRQTDIAWHRDNRLQRVAFGESIARERQELAKLLREVVRPQPVPRAAQNRSRHGVGAWSAPYAE